MNRNGISLILLIITIIIIIIIAGAVISSLNQSNIMGQTNEAKFKNDVDMFNNELQLYTSKIYLDTYGAFDTNTLNADATTTPNITDIIKSMTGKKNGGTLYTDILKIQTGKLVLKASINDESIIGWMQDLDVKTLRVESTSALWQFNSTTKTISKYLGSDLNTLTTITVPNYIDGIPVDKIIGDTDNWYSFLGNIEGLTLLKEVVISDGIKTIGDNAFESGSSITSIIIPDSVTYVGEAAFDGCSGLTNLSISNNVTTIQKWAFDGCSNLLNIDVDSNNQVYCDVDGVLFNKDKTSLYRYPEGKIENSYVIPNTVTRLEDSSFWGCSNPANITIPNSVEFVAPYTFGFCTSLTSLVIPDSVTYFGGFSLRRCDNLTTITIGNGLTGITGFLFYQCTALQNIVVSPSNTNYCTVDGILFNKTQTTLVKFPNGRTDNTYSIPGNVSTIGDEAFLQCENLTSMTIPNTVTNVIDDAFGECTNLTSVIIQPGVTTIKTYVFYKCDKLLNIIIPSTVTTIGANTFTGCTLLTNITLNKPSGSITGSKWGAPTSTVITWAG